MKYHVTAAKAALKTFLQANLPAQLTEADVDETEGVPTPLPAAIHRSDLASNGGEGYPVIELIATASRPTENSHADVMSHRIVVGVTVTGDDEETLSIWLERYLWAIRRLCKDELLAPTAFAGPIDTGAEEYTAVGHLESNVESPFVKGAAIELFVTTVE